MPSLPGLAWIRCPCCTSSDVRKRHKLVIDKVSISLLASRRARFKERFTISSRKPLLSRFKRHKTVKY